DRHVRRSGPDYAYALLSLMPVGQAWPTDEPESVMYRTLYGLAQYWGFVDGRAADLLERESDPRLTFELLTDWERNWGLPEPCWPPAPTLDERRKMLVFKMTLLGGQSRQWFYDVAEWLGYTIRITEFAPYMCGVSSVGDTRGIFNEGDADHYRWQLGPPEMRFYWTVHVDALKLLKFYTGISQTGIDRLLTIRHAEDLECVLNEWKPAHTQIIFDYSPFVALQFGETYNSQYLTIAHP